MLVSCNVISIHLFIYFYHIGWTLLAFSFVALFLTAVKLFGWRRVARKSTQSSIATSRISFIFNLMEIARLIILDRVNDHRILSNCLVILSSLFFHNGRHFSELQIIHCKHLFILKSLSLHQLFLTLLVSCFVKSDS